MNKSRKKDRIRKFIGLGLISGFVLLGLTPGVSAQQSWKMTIYYDYTYDITDDGYLTEARVDNNNRFFFRRAYFQYENKIAKNIKFRFRYDADRKADDKFRPFVKHLFLEWKNLIPESKIKAGMTETLTWSPIAEKKWGYRSVAKTLMDNYKSVTGKSIDATSADLGVSLSGVVSKEIRYAFMVSNGSHYSHPEKDKYKKFMGQLHLIPIAGLSLVGYADYEKQREDESAITYKADAFFEMVQGLVLGGEWFVYDSDANKIDDTSFNRSGFSFFGRYTAITDKLNVFARYDRYEPNTQEKDDEINLIIAGIDFTPVHSSFKIQPNIWIYSYADSEKKDDIVFNLTFYYTF